MQEVQYMPEITRRHFLYISAVSPFVLQLSALAQQNAGNANTIYPRTITVLQESFKTEMVAYKHYIGYTSKALNEKYPNIAYLWLYPDFPNSEISQIPCYSMFRSDFGSKEFCRFLFNSSRCKRCTLEPAEKSTCAPTSFRGAHSRTA